MEPMWGIYFIVGAASILPRVISGSSRQLKPFKLGFMERGPKGEPLRMFFTVGTTGAFGILGGYLFSILSSKSDCNNYACLIAILGAYLVPRLIQYAWIESVTDSKS